LYDCGLQREKAELCLKLEELMVDNEDKLSWCQYGEELEHEFLDGSFPVTLNPKKVSDKFTHDFFIHLPCDLKSIMSKWIKSESLFGIPSEHAISINQKDLQRYRDLYPKLRHDTECANGLVSICCQCLMQLI
jgi:hypothetical protein